MQSPRFRLCPQTLKNHAYSISPHGDWVYGYAKHCVALCVRANIGDCPVQRTCKFVTRRYPVDFNVVNAVPTFGALAVSEYHLPLQAYQAAFLPRFANGA